VGYSPGYKWLAIVSAALSGASYVLLLLLLGLFADLLVSRGQIPTYADLNDDQRAQFREQWNGLDQAERQQVLEELPISDVERQNLLGPAGERDPMGLRWKAYVGRYLQRRCGADAAAAYRTRAVSHDTDPERVQLGALSLVVRSRHSFLGPVVGGLTRFNAWMWEPSPSGVPNRPYLVGLLMLACLVAVIRAALVGLMHHGASHATLEAVTRLRRLLYHHTYRLGSLTVASSGANEALGTFTRHVDTVHDGLYSRLTVAVREPIKLLLLVTVAVFVNVWLALAVLCAAGLVWLIGRQTAIVFRRHGRAGARLAANQLSLLEESLHMMQLVKGYLMDLFNQGRVERQLSEYTRAQLQRFRGELVYRPLLIFLGTLAGAALLFVGGWIVLSEHLSVAGLVVLATAVASMYVPLDVWLANLRLRRRAEESAVAVFEFLDRKGEVGQVVGAEFLQPMSRRLEFDQVSLREPESGRMLLDGLTMTIPAGQRVAIVGADDAERHALAALIPRFLDPSSGEIKIDGKNLRWVTLDSLRSQVSVLMQDHVIFNDTVINNIGCGDPSYSMPQIIEAAKLVHAHHFIQRLPYGYETRIGELGHSLEAGERFRIGLARAVLRDPAILIIEEPRETLDDGTKKMLDDAYSRLLAGRTVIFLPHRLSTLKSCDHVYLIRDGKLVADGEHRQMLHDNELYRHLYYMEYYVLTEQ
jgi:ABC-type multidrug transport system fused ATPase/permease subunit